VTSEKSTSEKVHRPGGLDPWKIWAGFYFYKVILIGLFDFLKISDHNSPTYIKEKNRKFQLQYRSKFKNGSFAPSPPFFLPKKAIRFSFFDWLIPQTIKKE
jgi:hypothetical protein